jgi:hypothetical protein
VLIFLVGVALTLLPLAGDFLTALGLRTGSLLSGAKLSRVTLDPVRSYLTNHSADLPLSPDDLWAAWKVSGVVLFVSALMGFTGGRIGWALFGALTAPMIWTETARPAAWVATGIGVTWWSVLSIIAYGRSTKKSFSDGRGNKSDDEMTDRAEKQARKFDCDDLGDYFDTRGNQSIQTIAKELKVSKGWVSEHRPKYLPEQWISTKGSLSPGAQRKIIKDYSENNSTPGDLGRRHKCSTDAVKRLIERYKRCEE